MTTLECLPDKTLLYILLQSSVSTILTLSQVSKTFYRLSQDPILWKRLFQRDFQVKSFELIEESWKEEHEYHFRKKADLWLIKAAQTNDLNLIKYSLYHEARNYNEALLAAASEGNREIFDFLTNIMRDLSLLPNYNEILTEIVRKGYLDLMRDLMEDIKIRHRQLFQELDFGKILKVAAQLGRIEIIEEMYRTYKWTVEKESRHIILGAAYGGHSKIISKFQTQFSDKSDKRTLRRDILKSALEGGQCEMVNKLMKQIGKKELKQYWRNILKSALAGGNQKNIFLILSLLTNSGCKVDYKDVIHMATKYGQTNIFQLAESKLEEQNIQLKYGGLLNGAIIEGHLELVRLILQKVVLLNNGTEIIGILSRGSLHVCLGRNIPKNREEMVKLILSFIDKFGVAINHNTYLGMALEKGNLTIFKLLLKDAEIHQATIDYQFLLIKINGIQEPSEIFIFLLYYLIDKKIEFQPFQGLLDLIVKKGNIELLKLLIDKTEVNYQDLLDYAIYYRHLNIVNYLLGKIKEKDIKINYFQSLQSAISCESLTMVKIIWRLLQNNGAKLMDVFNSAYLYNNEKIFEFFLDLSQKDLFDHPHCMNLAIYAGNIRIVRSLLTLTPKMDTKGNFYFQMAVKTGNCQLVKLIHAEILKLGVTIDYEEAQKSFLEKEKEGESSRDCSRMTNILNIWANFYQNNISE